MSSTTLIPTDDKLIRKALIEDLGYRYKKNKNAKLIDEFNVNHGAARIDIAVINKVLHGYEIKSDRDTLLRLPEQIEEYNRVFDKITIVVGKTHLYHAINLIPDWWGVTLAKVDSNNTVIFNSIREPQENIYKESGFIAKILWKHEALNLLEDIGEARGLKTKPRKYVYEKLAVSLDQKTLSKKVCDILFLREGWRSDSLLQLSGD